QTGETWRNGAGSVVNTLTFTYDANGNRLTAADASGAYTVAYDALDRPSSTQEPFGLVLTNSYDAVGNRVRVDDSKGGVATSVYDAANRLTSRQFGGVGLTPLRFDQTFTARDQVAMITRYSDLAGTQTVGDCTYVYDAVGRVTSIQHRDGSAAVLGSYVYAYDLASRLTSEVIDGATRTFAYDAANELTSDGSAY